MTIGLITSALELALCSGAVTWCAYLAAAGDGGGWRVVASAGRDAPAKGSEWPSPEPPAPVIGRGLRMRAERHSGTSNSGTGDSGTGGAGRGEDAVWVAPAAARSGGGRAAAVLEALAAHLSVLLEAASAGHPELATDQVTGLLTRGAVMMRLAVEVARAQRHGGSLSVLLCELHLPAVENEAAAVGDARLFATGATLRRHLRQMDVAGRYERRTFLVVLPETTAEQALDAGARLAQLIEHAVAEAQPHAGMPASGLVDATHTSADEPGHLLRIGISTYPTPAKSAGEVVEQAERALAAARREGGEDWLRHWLDDLNEPRVSGFRCVCARCGRVFTVDYRAHQRARRFCSHACYVAARRTGEHARDEAIRAMRAKGQSLREIARRFGISAERVRQICRQTSAAPPAHALQFSDPDAGAESIRDEENA
ncbi:MAG: diguanylate cyclase [Chloroflexi bacterium]|nr:diguanylate cyclase [Chloroflexota bacterium]